jgi:hypothetical protein
VETSESATGSGEYSRFVRFHVLPPRAESRASSPVEFDQLAFRMSWTMRHQEREAAAGERRSQHRFSPMVCNRARTLLA